MAEKDKIQKTLEAYNDVFADIVNVLLFNGKRVVDEKDLTGVFPALINPCHLHKIYDRVCRDRQTPALLTTAFSYAFTAISF